MKNDIRRLMQLTGQAEKSVVIDKLYENYYDETKPEKAAYEGPFTMPNGRTVYALKENGVLRFFDNSTDTYLTSQEVDELQDEEKKFEEGIVLHAKRDGSVLNLRLEAMAGMAPMVTMLRNNGYDDFEMTDSDGERGPMDFDMGDEHPDGAMIRRQLDTMRDNIERLCQMVDDGADLPAWMNSKITIAAEYLDTATDVLDAKSDDVDAMGTDDRMNDSMKENAEGPLRVRVVANFNGRLYDVVIRTPKATDLESAANQWADYEGLELSDFTQVTATTAKAKVRDSGGEKSDIHGASGASDVDGEEVFFKIPGKEKELGESEDIVIEGRESGKTEHSGAKKGSGAYYGRKKEAKSDSNKARRQADKKAVTMEDAVELAGTILESLKQLEERESPKFKNTHSIGSGDESLEQAQAMLDAARRGLSIISRMKPGPERQEHASRIMYNMNKIRKLVRDAIKRDAGPDTREAFESFEAIVDQLEDELYESEILDENADIESFHAVFRQEGVDITRKKFEKIMNMAMEQLSPSAVLRLIEWVDDWAGDNAGSSNQGSFLNSSEFKKVVAVYANKAREKNNMSSNVQESEELDEKKLSKSEKDKLSALKKEYEGGKMHKAMRDQYGKEKGDDVFYGKLTKMAKESATIEEAKKKMNGEDSCWDGYEMVGRKKKNGKEVPNCVPKKEAEEIEAEIAVLEKAKVMTGSVAKRKEIDEAIAELRSSIELEEGAKGRSRDTKMTQSTSRGLDKANKKAMNSKERQNAKKDIMKEEEKEDTSDKFSKGDAVMYKGKKMFVKVPDGPTDMVGIAPTPDGKVDMVKADELSKAKEEVSEDQKVTELSKKKLGQYVKKAKSDAAGNIGVAVTNKNQDVKKDAVDKFNKRSKGIDKAVDKMTKEAAVDATMTDNDNYHFNAVDDMDKKAERTGQKDRTTVKNKVPREVMSSIDTRINEIKKSIERYDHTGYNDKSVKHNAIECLEQIKKNLSRGDHEGFMEAQVFFGTLMSPIWDLFPAQLVNYLGKGYTK